MLVSPLKELLGENLSLKDPKLHFLCGVKLHSYSLSILLAVVHVVILLVLGWNAGNINDIFRLTVLAMATMSLIVGLYRLKHNLLKPLILLHLTGMTILTFLSLYYCLCVVLPEIFATPFMRNHDYHKFYSNKSDSIRNEVFMGSLVLSLYCSALALILLVFETIFLKCSLCIEEEEPAVEKSWLYQYVHRDQQ